MLLDSGGITVVLLVYIAASVAIGAVIGRRVGYTIGHKAKIRDRTRRFVWIVIICILIGGTVGPLLGIVCLLLTSPM